jgi:hypothetical protein
MSVVSPGKRFVSCLKIYRLTKFNGLVERDKERVMKNSLLKLSPMLIAGALMVSGQVVFADKHADQEYIDFSKETPSASIEFNVTAIKLLVGATWGKGVLYYQGKEYPIKVQAGTAGGIGFQKVEGEGHVYFMNKLEDFAGKYGGGGMGLTVGVGKGAATLENSNGVIIRVNSKSSGVALATSLAWVAVKFAE